MKRKIAYRHGWWKRALTWNRKSTIVLLLYTLEYIVSHYPFIWLSSTNKSYSSVRLMFACVWTHTNKNVYSFIDLPLAFDSFSFDAHNHSLTLMLQPEWKDRSGLLFFVYIDKVWRWGGGALCRLFSKSESHFSFDSSFFSSSSPLHSAVPRKRFFEWLANLSTYLVFRILFRNTSIWVCSKIPTIILHRILSMSLCL